MILFKCKQLLTLIANNSPAPQRIMTSVTQVVARVLFQVAICYANVMYTWILSGMKRLSLNHLKSVIRERV